MKLNYSYLWFDQEQRHPDDKWSLPEQKLYTKLVRGVETLVRNFENSLETILESHQQSILFLIEQKFFIWQFSVCLSALFNF